MDILGVGNAASSAQPTRSRFDALKTEDFMRLLITELQNQDPLKPMENDQLLQQISTMNTITSTQTLVDTLKSLTLSQGLGAAGNLIGRTIRGMVGGTQVNGTVERVVVENGEVMLVVGGNRLPIAAVTEVQ